MSVLLKSQLQVLQEKSELMYKDWYRFFSNLPYILLCKCTDSTSIKLLRFITDFISINSFKLLLLLLVVVLLLLGISNEDPFTLGMLLAPYKRVRRTAWSRDR